MSSWCAAAACEQAIFGAASIDVKENEPGLLAFCAAHGWPCRFYSAAALGAVEGTFTASAFVARTVGVDNVCERSAVLRSGEHFCTARKPLAV